MLVNLMLFRSAALECCLVCYERNIDFHTLELTLLGDSGYTLAGYEY